MVGIFHGVGFWEGGLQPSWVGFHWAAFYGLYVSEDSSLTGAFTRFIGVFLFVLF